MADDKAAGAAAPEDKQDAPPPENKDEGKPEDQAKAEDQDQAAPDGGDDKDQPSDDEKGLLQKAAAEAAEKKKAEKEGAEPDEGEDKPEDKDKKAKEGEPYFPKDMPEHLKGKDDHETIDKLTKQVVGLRKELSKGGDVPKKADEYEEPEGVPRDDDALKVLREIALEEGISKRQYGAILSRLGPELAKAGILAAPMDPQEEAKKLGDEGPAMIQHVLAKVDQMKEQGFLSDDEYNEALIMFGNATAIRTGLKMFQYFGEREIPTMPAKSMDKPMSEQELRALQKDSRYNASSPEFDQDYYNWVQEQFRKFYGDKPAGSSKTSSAA